ncbi:hypothetical protein CIB48_g4327 [Xylaria polymorpha]|nr:hypothetical protein CIB48_g4327 [Xylaria polymorpha]
MSRGISGTFTTVFHLARRDLPLQQQMVAWDTSYSHAVRPSVLARPNAAEPAHHCVECVDQPATALSRSLLTRPQTRFITRNFQCSGRQVLRLKQRQQDPIRLEASPPSRAAKAVTSAPPVNLLWAVYWRVPLSRKPVLEILCTVLRARDPRHLLALVYIVFAAILV